MSPTAASCRNRPRSPRAAALRVACPHPASCASRHRSPAADRDPTRCMCMSRPLRPSAARWRTPTSRRSRCPRPARPWPVPERRCSPRCRRRSRPPEGRSGSPGRRCSCTCRARRRRRPASAPSPNAVSSRPGTVTLPSNSTRGSGTGGGSGAVWRSRRRGGHDHGCGQRPHCSCGHPRHDAPHGRRPRAGQQGRLGGDHLAVGVQRAVPGSPPRPRRSDGRATAAERS